jgi:hypothetical protein
VDPWGGPTPFIQIMARSRQGDEGEGCQRFGTELNFSVAQVTGFPERLRGLIARALVEAYHYATGEFYRLHMELLEKPFNRWKETRRPKTDAARDRQWNALAKAYRRQSAARIAALLDRWGAEAGQAGALA